MGEWASDCWRCTAGVCVCWGGGGVGGMTSRITWYCEIWSGMISTLLILYDRMNWMIIDPGTWCMGPCQPPHQPNPPDPPDPASKEMLGQHWANVITYVGATSEMTLGQRGFVHRCNVGTTFCQSNNLLHFIIFDGCYYVGTMYYEWLAKRWHNFIIAHCLSTIMI